MNDRKKVEGIMWRSGTILNGEWQGVPLRSFLLELGFPADFEARPQLAKAHVHFTSRQQCEEADEYESSILLRDAMYVFLEYSKRLVI